MSRVFAVIYGNELSASKLNINTIVFPEVIYFHVKA